MRTLVFIRVVGSFFLFFFFSIPFCVCVLFDDRQTVFSLFNNNIRDENKMYKRQFVYSGLCVRLFTLFNVCSFIPPFGFNRISYSSFFFLLAASSELKQLRVLCQHFVYFHWKRFNVCNSSISIPIACSSSRFILRQLSASFHELHFNALENVRIQSLNDRSYFLTANSSAWSSYNVWFFFSLSKWMFLCFVIMVGFCVCANSARVCMFSL